MSISDQITRLQNAKASIKTSIENKGVTVPNDAKLDAFPALIDDIQAGGSGETHVNPDFYEVRTQNGTNFNNLFRGYDGPDIDVSKWDTSKVTSAKYCFSYCYKSMDISNWDLSSLTNAQYMFDGFNNGKKCIDLSVLDFSNVSSAQNMFSYSNTDYLDVRNIKLPKATNYSSMFSSCDGTELDLSSWDISKVADITNMCSSSDFTKINLTGWNTINITHMSYAFYYCSNLKTLLIPDWDMTNATNTGSFIYSCSKLKYIDLSRSNDLTIKKIASFLPTKKATTYGEILIPADTSQDAIDTLMAKYWKPIGPKIDLNSTELALELDEIKPGKTTKIWTINNDPWYGDDRLETIEFISSNESIATINGREITGVAEGTTEITCRRRDTQEVISTVPITLTVSETDSNPNLIKFRTKGNESPYAGILAVNGSIVKISDYTKDPITGICSYDPGKQITSIKFNYSSSGYINEIIKFNFNAANITSMANMFSYYKGEVIDISDWDTSKVTGIYQAFYDSKTIKHIIGELDMSNVNAGRYSYQSDEAFHGCSNLETIYLKNIYKNTEMSNDNCWSINLGDTKVKDECLIYIINELPNLYDKGLTATDKIKLTLPPNNKLTAEQVQVATSKGWTVVNCNFS